MLVMIAGTRTGEMVDKEKLQKPSPAPALLNQMLRQVLLELETVSQVRSARMDGETARLKPGSSPPTGPGERVARKLSVAYGECTNNWDRLMVIRKAQRILADVRGKKDQSKVRGTRQWKSAIANDARASAIVGAERGISGSYVRKLRRREKMG